MTAPGSFPAPDPLPLTKSVIGNKTCVHGPDIPIPTPPLSQTEIASTSDAEDGDVPLSLDIESKNPQPFNQSELNDLVRDLGLTKEKSELLGSRLKQIPFSSRSNLLLAQKL
jgi:hypothetical protein